VASTILVLGALMAFTTTARAQPVTQVMLLLPCERPSTPNSSGTLELRCRVAPDQVVSIMLLMPTDTNGPKTTAIAQLSHMPNPFGSPADTINPFPRRPETLNPFAAPAGKRPNPFTPASDDVLTDPFPDDLSPADD
jgi:hypothetical protein